MREYFLNKTFTQTCSHKITVDQLNEKIPGGKTALWTWTGWIYHEIIRNATYLLFDLLLLLVAYTVPKGLGLTLRFILLQDGSMALLARTGSNDTISALIIRTRKHGSHDHFTITTTDWALAHNSQCLTWWLQRWLWHWHWHTPLTRITTLSSSSILNNSHQHSGGVTRGCSQQEQNLGISVRLPGIDWLFCQLC